MYPESLKNLIESFKLLPGIGEKTAERLAFFVLNLEQEEVSFFSESIVDAKEKLHPCKVCNNITDKDICNICSDNNRDCSVLCILEDIKSMYMFEKSNIFRGYYYIIKDLISPINGINPEDIGLEDLLKRIKVGSFKEVIIAVKPSIEGETTSLYIKRILEGLDIKVTRIASGIPMGADIEYIDSLTLERAIIDRKELE